MAWERIAGFSVHEGRFRLWEVDRKRATITAQLNGVNEFPILVTLLKEATTRRDHATDAS